MPVWYNPWQARKRHHREPIEACAEVGSFPRARGTLEYAVNFAELPLADNCQAFRLLRARRLLQPIILPRLAEKRDQVLGAQVRVTLEHLQRLVARDRGHLHRIQAALE